ncbi:MAG: hypothetical protein WBH57_04610 [Anaerolineae bacterium]
MQKWEYRRVGFRRQEEGLVSVGYTEWEGYDVATQQWMPSSAWWADELKSLGEQGWELVTAVPVASTVMLGRNGNTTELTFYFKRPLQNT